MKVQTRKDGYVLEASDETAQELIDAGLFMKADSGAPLGSAPIEPEEVKPSKRRKRNG